jgi:hypothetical protein
VRAASRRAQRWIGEQVSDDRQEWDGAVVVERRHVGDIIRGTLADGLRVRRHFAGVGDIGRARPIAGADDVLVPREVESSDPARWAEYNRKFNEFFTRGA